MGAMRQKIGRGEILRERERGKEREGRKERQQRKNKGGKGKGRAEGGEGEKGSEGGEPRDEPSRNIGLYKWGRADMHFLQPAASGV